MSEYNEEDEDEQYQVRVALFNRSLMDYTLFWSTLYHATGQGLGLAEVWFQCLACDNVCGVEQMYLLCEEENGRVVMQNLSTFYNVESDGEYSGVESIFDLDATVIVMICRECVVKYGYDPDSVEIIEPDYKESKLL